MDLSFGVGATSTGFGSARAVEAQRETSRIISNGQSGRDVRGRSFSDGAPTTGPSEMVLAEQKSATQSLRLEQQKSVQLSARARAGGGPALGEASVTQLYGPDGRQSARTADTNGRQAAASQNATGSFTFALQTAGIFSANAVNPARAAPPVEPLYSVAAPPAKLQPREVAAARAADRAADTQAPVASVANTGRAADSPGSSGVATDQGFAQARQRADARLQPEAVRRAESGIEITPWRPDEGQSDVMRQRVVQAYQIVPQATPASISLRA